MIPRTALLAALLLVASSNAFAPPAQLTTSLLRKHETAVFLSEEIVEELEELVEEEVSNIDEAAAEDYIVNVGDLEGDDDEEGIAPEDDEPPAWYTSQQRIQELRVQHRRHDRDTGSPEFQVAGMTERISYLTKHLKIHPKDFSTRRGLVALVNKRRRLLNYLYKEDVQRYSDIIKSLGIRHKSPGRVADRAEKYSRFPGQKAIKRHLLK